MRSSIVCVIGLALAAAACSGAASDRAPDWATVQDTTHRVAGVEGLAGPEAVRYDPEQDVYFVANFNGEAAGDSNGFISRVGPDGVVESLRFMVGAPDAPLHGPRGMAITGDTLWVADAEGIHGFDRHNGTHLRFVDFGQFEPGFLNDIAPGPDGALYITDTGRSRVYRMMADDVAIAVEDSLLGPPNGITWDAEDERFILAPWGSPTFHAWRPPGDELEPIATGSTSGRFDGIEIVSGRVIAASQVDSSLHVLEDGSSRPFIRVPGRPADIGVDTQRGRVAVPYIALDRVDIWRLPGGER
jgi:sugar lactone lactonase YvrE